jgi:hypothetical protein
MMKSGLYADILTGWGGMEEWICRAYGAQSFFRSFPSAYALGYRLVAPTGA